MTVLTDSLDLVTQYIVDKIVTAAAAGAIKSADNLAVLTPGNVFYGDQVKYPATPAIAVEPGGRPRTLMEVSYRTENNFSVFIMCYHAGIQDNQLTRKQIQQISEGIETLIHQDPQFGGLLVHGFCENNDSGYVYRQSTMYRTNRISFSGYSKTRLR